MPVGESSGKSEDAAYLADVEAGRRLFAQRCVFVAGATSTASLPEFNRTEVAFAGRSNVGKSSLINALVGQSSLARVSHTPGRTQAINFFDLGGALMLVDLPGYGFARAAKSKVRDWTRLEHTYLRGRPTLRRLCLLIDARHGLKDADREFMDLLDEAAVSYQAVLTKSDKVPKASLPGVVAALAAALAARPAAHPDVIPTSARTGSGIPDLRAALAALAAPAALG